MRAIGPKTKSIRSAGPRIVLAATFCALLVASFQVRALVCGPELSAVTLAAVKDALLSVHTFWAAEFKTRGWAYETMEVALYDGRASSPCGLNTRAQGPVYCWKDRTLYLDLQFFAEKRASLGPLNGAFLEYVLAHEYGHHIQLLRKVFDTAGELGPKAYGTSDFAEMIPLLEDQSECLAGLYLSHRVAKGQLKEADLADVRERVSRISQVAPETVVTKIGAFFDKLLGNLTGRRVWLDEGIRGSSLEVCEPFEFNTLK